MLQEDNNITDNANDQDIKRLVVERVKATSGNIHIHVGSNQAVLSKEELLKNIAGDTQVGQQLVKQQLAYIQATATGEIYKLLQND